MRWDDEKVDNDSKRGEIGLSKDTVLALE